MLLGGRARPPTTTWPCERANFLRQEAPGHMQDAHQKQSCNGQLSAPRAFQAWRTTSASTAPHPRRQICAGRPLGSRQHGASGDELHGTRTPPDEPATTPRAAAAPPECGGWREHRLRGYSRRIRDERDPARRRAQRGVSWAGLVRNAGRWRVLGGRFALCMGCTVRTGGCLGQRGTWL